MTTPYYQDERVTLYHGDWRSLAHTLPKFDLLLTNPPYGIADKWVGGKGHGWGKAWVESTVRNEWDAAAPTDEDIDLLLTLADEAVIWGGNYFPLPPSRGWLVWNKPERNFTLAEAELAWTSRDMVIRVADLPRSEPGRQHPTQKPLRLMSWCLGFFPKARTVVDTYSGSGTSLVAAKAAGLSRIVGFEAWEPYCEIAARRLASGRARLRGARMSDLPPGCVVLREACDARPARDACHTLAHVEVIRLGSIAGDHDPEVWAGHTIPEHASGACTPCGHRKPTARCPHCHPRRAAVRRINRERATK